MVSPVQQIEALYQRLEHARKLVADDRVHPVAGMEGHHIVQGKGGYYLVNAVCTCQDAQQRADIHHGWCKHMLAAELFKEMPKEEKPKAKKSKASGADTAAEADEMHRYGHYAPGDASPIADGRSIDEQIADLYPTNKESAPSQLAS